MQSCLRNTSNSFHCFHFLFILIFIVRMLIPSFYFSMHRFQQLCIIMQNFLSMNLNLKSGKAVEMVFLFLIACFYNKMSHTHWTFVTQNHTSSLCFLLFLFSKNKLLCYTISSWGKTSVISCLTPGHWDTTSKWHRLWTTQVHTTGKRTKQTQIFLGANWINN